MKGILKVAVFFSTEGQPVHVVWSKPVRGSNRFTSMCGRLMPTFYSPKPRHYCNASKLCVLCPACQRLLGEYLTGRAKEQADAETVTQPDE